jgi:hypothetical protein
MDEIWTWNVRSLYRLGSLKTVASELVKYKFDLVMELGVVIDQKTIISLSSAVEIIGR